MSLLDVTRWLGLSCRRFGVVMLWICIFVGMASAERTCGSHFVDVGSSALLAPIVVEGRARRVLYDTGELPGGIAADSRPTVNVIFDNLRLYKGQLTESAEEVRSIEVGYFAIRSDAEACVAPLPERRRSYVLFVRARNNSQTNAASTNISSTQNDDSRRRRVGYQLSAFPVRKSRRNIATVMEYTNCSRCGRPPTVRLLPETAELQKQAGQRLELICRSRRGRPTARIVWSRDGVVLADRVNRVRISSSRSRSRLRVRRLQEEDAGLYQCQALNVVGQSETRGINVVVAPDVEPTQLHSVLCSEQGYCLNGGTCFIMVSLGRRYCLCRDGFQGRRCQEKDLATRKMQAILTRGDRRLNTVETVLLISGVVAAALVVVAIAIICYSSARRSAVEREIRRRKELDDSRRLLSWQQQQQANESVAESSASPGDIDGVVLRHQTTQSNGQVSQSNRLSDPRRSRLQAASATLESEDLNNPANVFLWTNNVQQRPPQSRDNLRQTLPVNGDDCSHVEKETTC